MSEAKVRYILMNYTTQCIDVSSGRRGCFIFDVDHWKETGEFRAVGAVYPDLQALYDNTSPSDRRSLYEERESS